MAGTNMLSQTWPEVRRELLRRCGIRRNAATLEDSRTDHCFADSNHVECCVPSSPSSYNNDNRSGSAVGISRSNKLPMDIFSGRWCTCQSGEVCRRQFGTEPRWWAVWLPRAYTTLALVKRNGDVLAFGTPQNPLPPMYEREQSFDTFQKLNLRASRRALQQIRLSSKRETKRGSRRGATREARRGTRRGATTKARRGSRRGATTKARRGSRRGATK